jgi:hypothetical protein
VVGLLDCAPTLGVCLAQVDAGLSFVRRTGSEQPNQWLQCYHWLADVLRREGTAGEAPPADIYESNPLSLVHVYLTRAIAAANLRRSDRPRQVQRGGTAAAAGHGRVRQ